MPKPLPTHSVHDARANLAHVIDEALDGRPQRIARRGREAVVVMSEAEWERRRVPPNLGGYLAALSRVGGAPSDEELARSFPAAAPEAGDDFVR